MKELTQCIYRNENAGHRIRVKVIARTLPRMWLVEVLEKVSRFPKGETLTVPEQDLIEA